MAYENPCIVKVQRAVSSSDNVGHFMIYNEDHTLSISSLETPEFFTDEVVAALESTFEDTTYPKSFIWCEKVECQCGAEGCKESHIMLNFDTENPIAREEWPNW